VLFCIGYSFYDEHINDIIKQALSIPSFTLIIANFSPTKDLNSPIEELRKLNDKRIIIIDEADSNQSTFIGFIDNVMPDLYEEEENEVIANTLEKLYEKTSAPNAESNLTLESNDNSLTNVIDEKRKKADEIDPDDLPF
jgi:hypothetical protein